MKVAQLIEQLKQLPPDLPVEFFVPLEDIKPGSPAGAYTVDTVTDTPKSAISNRSVMLSGKGFWW